MRTPLKSAGDSGEVGRGGVVGGLTGSARGGDVKSVALGSDLSHAFSFQDEAVGVVDEAKRTLSTLYLCPYSVKT